MGNKTQLIEKIEKLGFKPLISSYKNEADQRESLHTNRYWELPCENHKLRGTPFYYKGKKDFVHFTSLEALYSILNSKSIRLYNLQNMDDKFELDYASSELLLSKPLAKDKEELYIFSMSSSDEVLKNKIKEHLLWKLYGKNGFGVIIRVEIRNKCDSWYNFHLAKMFYNLDRFNSIKELNKETQIENLDTKFTCFFKLPIYKFENEIRLVFDNRNPTEVFNENGKKVYPITYPDKLHLTKKILYTQIPLLNFNDYQSDVFIAPNTHNIRYEVPKIEITDIIIGYRYSETELENIREKVASLIQNVDVKISNLKEYF